jgi:UDP-N-acetyl-D-mannosaminuronic acid dehydrogenase
LGFFTLNAKSESAATVAVIGLGYVGLPTAALVSHAGMQVIGIDVNLHAVAKINAGEVHIREPGLQELVSASVADGKLRATATMESADVFIIAVPTPFMNDRAPDLTFVRAATTAISTVLKPGNLVLLESTSPVGTTEMIADLLCELRPELEFAHRGAADGVSVAYCPERVLPGNALAEMVRNDRVVGGLTDRCSQRASDFYARFIQGRLITTNARTAEMCKLTENSFRDLNIAFANELSLICDELDINVWELINLANRHPRVSILQPGPGVGGHCIAVDPWFIVNRSPETARLIRTAREVNDGKPHWVLDKVKRATHGILAVGRKDDMSSVIVACLGLSFKANIDDFRESPAMQIALNLAQKHEGGLLVVEPNLIALPSDFQGAKNTQLVGLDQALATADVVLLLVDHDEFKTGKPVQLRPGQVLVDTKGIWQDVTQKGAFV